ncbi:phage GP46 family protein [Vibrio sp. 10N.261.46.A3]|uniref:phage GP46 family protein n=1 Tax=Vibrio sp. 10N.261.46.A3 TaxID=3229658 RepID=UPI00354D9977
MSTFKLCAITAPEQSEVGITHAVMQSLLNHSESTQNDRVRMGADERGGHWSDALSGSVGSRDWTLGRAKLTDETLKLAKRFYEEALAWLLTKEYISSIDVHVWEVKANIMGRKVMITLANGQVLTVPLSEVEK